MTPSTRSDPAAAGPPAADVVVVGGGVIGLTCAWRLAGAGLQVAVADPTPTRGATWAAAGMLAPVTEVHFGEEALLALNLASARRWAGFAAELEEASGQVVGLRREGTLLVAGDAGDRAWAEQLLAFQQSLGLPVQWLGAAAARQREPMLAPGIRGALWAPEDHQVDNRRLAAALVEACRRAGVVSLPVEALALDLTGGAVTGVQLADGSSVACSTVVLAAGCWSGQLGGVPAGAVPPVRPVKGQILRLRPPPAGAWTAGTLLGHTVRGMVQGSHVYLVPRADGELVVGATMEEQGFDTSVTAGAVYQLLRDAQRLVPGLSELVLDEARAGLRPASPDNGPLIGPTSVPGLVLATGHHRNGILLSALTGDAVAAIVTATSVPAEVAAFTPGRFADAAEEPGARR
jgi:glycine oxidase